MIGECGIQEFFEKVYLTNISRFGFTQNGKSLNYHSLSDDFQDIFTANFIGEMTIVQPSVVILLGQEVEKSLKKMKTEGKLHVRIAERLPHPFAVSFTTKRKGALVRYVEAIKSHSA